MDMLPDLSSYKSTELVKVNQDRIDQLESGLDLYAPMLRTLQLRPLAYVNFGREILFVIRQKHIIHLRRGTEASIRSLTEFLLRGFGRHIWVENSPWLIEASLLEDDEERLLYDRKEGKSGNARLFAMFEPLWKQMRNLMFEPKELDERLVHRQAFEKVVPGTYNTSTTATEESRVEKWSAARTDSSICEIMQLLAETIQNSDELVLRDVWNTRVGEMGDKDVSHAVVPSVLRSASAELGEVSNLPDDVPMANSNTDQTNTPNEPWVSKGNCVSKQHAPPYFAQNDPPGDIAVWISKAKVISYGEATPICMSPGAWHLPSIRVTPDSMHDFISNINTRADIPDGCLVLCYVLSYGWNDTMSVINADDPNARMSDGSLCNEKFTAGWNVLQENLRGAAQAGNNIWRVKVLVLYTTYEGGSGPSHSGLNQE